MKRLIRITVILSIFSFFFISVENANAQFSKFKKKAAKKKEKKVENAPDVDQVLQRVRITKANFQGATKCVNQSRDALFDIAATSEKKEQLKMREKELAEVQSDAEKERITIEINQMKDEEINRAHKSGELENKKLNKQQLKNFGNLIFNMGLAALLDKNAIHHGPKIISDGQAAIKAAQKNKFKAAKMAGKIKELSNAVSKDLPEILAEAPDQVETLGAFLAAANSLKKNNKIEDLGEPKEDDQFQEVSLEDSF